MAVLTNGQLVAVYADFVAELNAAAGAEAIGISKAELKAAIVAIDGWLDANAAAFNQAIPQPARSALSLRQKARILRLVAKHRYGAL